TTGVLYSRPSLHEQPAARDGAIDTRDPGSIGASGDEKIAIAPRVERGFDLGEHLLDRDDLLARQIAAAIGKDLVADEQGRDSRSFESAHHLAHVVHATEAGIGVDIDRYLHCRTDARVMVRIVAHVTLAHI